MAKTAIAPAANWVRLPIRSTRARVVLSVAEVVAENPPNNATNVPLNAIISLQASEPIDSTTISSSVYQIYDLTLNQYVAGTFSQSPDGTTIAFLPGSLLGANHQVGVSVLGLTDLAGNSASAGFSFTTGVKASTTAPQVSGISPATGLTGVPVSTVIAIQFNEPVNAETLGQIALTASGNPVITIPTLSNGNQTLTLIPAGELIQNATYTVMIAGVKDMAGNAMAAAFTSTFTTGTAPDLSTPSVLSVSPADTSSGVARATTIQLKFSKLMNRLSINRF